MRARGRSLLLGILGALLFCTALALAAPQRGGGMRGIFGLSGIDNAPYDGRFRFCRVMFRQAPWGDGGGWSVDYPRADLNLPYRLSQLSTISVSKDSRGEPRHALISLMDDELFRCPFVMMTEVGGAYFDDEEADRLRKYLLKGGFLWADDFWGEYAWNVWADAIGKVLPPSDYPIVDVPLTHPIFHNFYEVHSVPQIPSINVWLGRHETSERGWDSREPHVRAIENESGHIMVLITHNTDFGDAFEREGDNREYFDEFAAKGYAFAANAVIYSLTH